MALALALPLVAAGPAEAQERGSPDGEWRYQSGDAWGTRYSPLERIDASNFEELEVAWLWRGDNFGPSVDHIFRSTPIYVDGMLYTVAGRRRTVAALDPATGETLWTFREPHTTRWARSPRQAYGKGVAYGELDGRGVIYITTPAFFLWALDAKTGRPLEDWGEAVPLDGFPESGVADLLPDLLDGWGPWEAWDEPYDPDYGIPRQLGMITSSSPPIVVDEVVVVGNSHEPGYNQTRIENVPGDILAYDARSGDHEWTFHVIPRPGEPGHQTWENDAWKYTGDVSSWAPMSADLERGIVYVPTNPPTIDYYGGFRPGANLYGTSVIALDVGTGERLWHFQTVHNDQWNYDLPNVPLLADLTVDGEEIPALIQTTKQGLTFTFDRETGEPVWPIEERPVPQTEVPGNWTSPTQPFPTRPEPMEPLGLPDDQVIDFTAVLKERAKEAMEDFRIGGPYLPRLHVGHDADVANNLRCKGGVNVYHPSIVDPTTGILYASHKPGCSGGFVMPGHEADELDTSLPEGGERRTPTTGATVAEWVPGPGGRGLPRIQGLPIFKPPWNRLSAYDMNSGERIWWIPVGDVPAEVENHPALEGVDLSDAGWGGFSTQGGETIHMIMGDLLVYTTEDLRGEAERSARGEPLLKAADKRTGELLASVELPVPGQYGMMTYLHEGSQYLVVQVASSEHPGSLLALRLP